MRLLGPNSVSPLKATPHPPLPTSAQVTGVQPPGTSWGPKRGGARARGGGHVAGTCQGPSPAPEACLALASAAQGTLAVFHGEPEGPGNATPPGSFRPATRGHEQLPAVALGAEAARRRHRRGDSRLMYSLEELLPLQRDTSTNCIRLAHLLFLLRPRFVGKLEGRQRERELG